MYDSTIHARTLAREFRDADFVLEPSLLNVGYREQVLKDAEAIGDLGFTSLSLTAFPLRGKTVYGLSNIAHLLVLRQITANIRHATGAKQDNRNFIMECMASLLREGVSYRLYKFDIRSFYESVEPNLVVNQLTNDVLFPSQSAKVLSSFFQQLAKASVTGLPRGLAISATLAEYLMKKFDELVAEKKGVLYYSRFVDDICVITDGAEDDKAFTLELSSRLPQGLVFNNRSKPYFFSLQKKKNGELDEHHIDYLGYRLYISYRYRDVANDILIRKVRLDISPSKVRKFKTRVAKAMLQFNRDGKYVDLRDRVRLLTGNFSLSDGTVKRKRLSGIHYNYILIDPEHSTALRDLDRYLANAIMSSHPCNKIRPKLSDAQRIELVRYSFQKGFEKKMFFHFPPSRLARLTNCWAYV